MVSLRERQLVGVLLLAIVGMWGFCALYSGALHIPQNDAWSHTRISETLAQSGQVQLVGWNRSSLMGMIVPAALLGGSPLAGNLVGLFSAFLTLYWAYSYARLRLNAGRSWLLVLVLVAVPGMALLGTSFMADLPMLAGIAGALFYGQRYSAGGLKRDLCAATFLGFWAFTIREQGLAVLAALFALLVVRKEGRRAGAFAATVGFAVVVFELWRRSLPYDDPPSFNLDARLSTFFVVEGLISLSFFFLPVTLWAVVRRGFWGIRRVFLALAVSLVFVAYAVPRGFDAFPPNYFSATGAYAAASVGERHVFPSGVMVFCCALAVLGAGLLFVVALEKLGSSEYLVGQFFALFYFAGVVVQTYTGQGMFGRYMIPLVLALAPSLLAGGRASLPGKVLSGASWLLMFTVSSLLFLEALAFNTALWKAGQDEVRAGAQPTDVYAGFTWYGYHSQGPMGEYERPGQGFSPYLERFPDTRECLILGAPDARLPDAQATLDYRRYLFFGPQEHIYRSESQPCH